ncbi:hypothetical protein TanjilG_12180 [Lupinus angustifolius]|uniref:Uncharacterized protein n=1 Tax=Lupinus angustifolius TaxID=3871 RepID=A0A1J7H711_LUPAN|nr:PREDICTED: uncharacterized protein LOC109326475 [Lupinus angustifolius]OIV98144.1 hypothetical protein TanjilG_12180 [Lupinus angustifolius]
MEGLLPIVYKAIKKNRTRRHYECLSSGDNALTYNISMAEMYPQTQGHVFENQTPKTTHKVGHRRSQSVPDFTNGLAQMRNDADSPSSKQVLKFKSQRICSCITGA